MIEIFAEQKKYNKVKEYNFKELCKLTKKSIEVK